MRYEEYTDFKNSHLEWLDVIPSHWDGGRLRWFSHIYAGGTPSKEKEEYWADGTVPWLNSGAVNQVLINEPSAYITESAYANSSAKWIPKGALVMALAGQGKTKGMIAQLAIDTTCNQSMAAIVPNNMYNARYLYWWLNSNYQNIRNMAGGDLRDGLNLDILGNIQCPIPSNEEQTQIATFLDRETQKIGRLIEKQQQLIKLLQEKRQAVISHAVTKGLNPNAKMKDSGVEWLGEIPEHWEVKRLKYVCSLVTKKIPTDNLKVIALENIESQTGKYIQTESIYSGEDVGFVAGDILFGKLRPYLSKVYMADESGVAFGDLLVYRPTNKVSSEYAFYQMISDSFISTVDSSTYGSKMPRASVDFTNDMPFLVPPLKEQESISNFLKTKISMFEKLIEKANRAIKLSKERRTALISAAVTGKIDVREAVNG